jgi:hypothetical protein
VDFKLHHYLKLLTISVYGVLDHYFSTVKKELSTKQVLSVRKLSDLWCRSGAEV